MSYVVGNKKSVPEEFQKAIFDLEVLTESKAFIFIYNGNITRPLVGKICGIRKELSSAKRIIAIVHSGGGSIDAAHKLLQLLREDGKGLDVYVPEYAKSAATFLCLGADNIIMHKNAELGPLDPQIRDPKSRRFISALDRSKSIDYLRNHAIQTFDMITQLILRRTDFVIKDAMDVAQVFTKNICEPLYAKVDPDKLGEYTRLIKIGEEYTRRAMNRYGYNGRGQEAIETILNKIIYGYPSHGFIIDYQEAKELNLNVRVPTAEEESIIDRIAVFIGKVECVGTLSPVPDKKEPREEVKKADGEKVVERTSGS